MDDLGTTVAARNRALRQAGNLEIANGPGMALNAQVDLPSPQISQLLSALLAEEGTRL